VATRSRHDRLAWEIRVKVPYFRPSLGREEIDEVVATLESGWLTSGPRVKRFEESFVSVLGARHALAVNSCTAALHLAVEALHLQPGQAVLVPTMTFAATAEVVRYLGAVPILVDCDPVTLNMSLEDAEAKIAALAGGALPGAAGATLVGVMPVHVGGLMMDVGAVRGLADRHGLWVVEDAAHAFPAAWRRDARSSWQRCGAGTADVSCFSFYANKTITTGEGGMAVTASDELDDRMRIMALHGLSRDAWSRYSGGGSWDYRIVAPGFKYNLTDIAAALGIHQLARAEELRRERQAQAERYLAALADVDEVELPPVSGDRIHAWHLFPLRLRLDRLGIDRNAFVEELRKAGVGFSVHWRPLHLHPYYEELGWRPEHCPNASQVWPRLVSLPLFPGMRDDEHAHVVATLRDLCRRHRRKL
jgi:dTDP-4-amino-4,6-dideoxygalactose transaminase